MLIPISTLSDGMACMDKEFDVYPIWICPMRIFKEDSGFLHPTKSGEEMFVDVGVYGVPGCGTGRRGEDFVRDAEGFQMLYADMYQTREEFREMFDHTLLDKMRAQSAMTRKAFPEVYDKVCKSART